MKRPLVLVLVAVLVGGPLAAAQSAIFEEPNAAVTASFYRGDPADGACSLRR